MNNKQRVTTLDQMNGNCGRASMLRLTYIFFVVTNCFQLLFRRIRLHLFFLKHPFLF